MNPFIFLYDGPALLSRKLNGFIPKRCLERDFHGSLCRRPVQRFDEPRKHWSRDNPHDENVALFPQWERPNAVRQRKMKGSQAISIDRMVGAKVKEVRLD
jgi:hypothetical protein